MNNLTTAKKWGIAVGGALSIIVLMVVGFSVGFSIGNTEVEFSGKTRDDLHAAVPTPYSGIVYPPTLSPDAAQAIVELDQSIKFTLLHDKNPDDDTQYDYELFLHGNDNAPGDFDGLVRLNSCDENGRAYSDSLEPGNSFTLFACESGNVGIEVVAVDFSQGREYRTDYNLIVTFPPPPDNASLSSLTLHNTDDSNQVFLDIDNLPSNPEKYNKYYVRVPSDVMRLTTIGEVPHPAITVEYGGDMDHAIDGEQTEIFDGMGYALVIAKLWDNQIRYTIEIIQNMAPQIEAIPDQVVELDSDDHTITITASDPDGYIVSYEATSSDSDKVSASLDGNILTLTAHEHVSEDAPVTITVKVRDNTESVSITFQVTVPDDADEGDSEDAGQGNPQG